MTENENIIDLIDIIEEGKLDENAPSLEDLLGSLNNLREKSQTEEINNSPRDKSMPKKTTLPIESPNTDILFDEFDSLFNDALEKSPVAKFKQDSKVEEISDDDLKALLEQSLPYEEDPSDNKINSLEELDDILNSLMLEEEQEIDLMEELEKAERQENIDQDILHSLDQELNISKSRQNTAIEPIIEPLETIDSPERPVLSLDISEENFENLESDQEAEIDFSDLDKLLASIDLPEQPSLEPNIEALKVLEDLINPSQAPEELLDVEVLSLDELKVPELLNEPIIELSDEAKKIAPISQNSEQGIELIAENASVEPLKQEIIEQDIKSNPELIAENSNLEISPEPREKINNTEPRFEELLVDFATQKSVLELMEKRILEISTIQPHELESLSAKFNSELEIKLNSQFEAKFASLNNENQSLKNSITQNQERLLKLIEQNAKLELVVEGLLTKQLQSQNLIEQLQNQSNAQETALNKLDSSQNDLLATLEQKVASCAAKVIQEEIAALLQQESSE